MPELALALVLALVLAPVQVGAWLLLAYPRRVLYVCVPPVAFGDRK